MFTWVPVAVVKQMDVLLNIFAIFSLFISHPIYCYGDGKELVLVHILYRHGDRSPVESFPTDQHKESEWPQGFGQLTQLGMQQHYELGQYLRQRYVFNYRLLDENYNRYQVHLRSTDFDRTLMSAYSNLAGLFPPNGSEIWSPSLLWQPIPVHTQPGDSDFLLNVDVPCPKYSEELDKVYKSEFVKKEEQENKEFYEFIDNVTGTSHIGIRDVWDIYDTLFCEQNHGLSVPLWVNKTWNGVTTFDKLRSLHDLSFFLEYNKTILHYLRGGPIVGDMVDHMKAKVSGTLDKMKAYIYSGHDSTICAFLSALKIFNGKAPPYRAAVFVELWKSGSQYTVEILYKNDSTKEPERLVLPGCSGSCPLDSFVNLTKAVIPKDVKAECQTVVLKVQQNLWFLMTVVFAALSAALLVAIIISVILRRPPKGYNYRPLTVNP